MSSQSVQAPRQHSEATLTEPKMLPGTNLPRIAFNLRHHKVSIAINWAIIFTTSGILPILLYFTLRYAAHLKLNIVLAITTSIFGAFTLFALGKRMFSLLRPNSTTRPLGASRAALDFFHWNFMFGFVVVTVIIVVGNITENIRVVAMGASILLVDVCAQLLIAGVMTATGATAPFRMSSVEKGERVRGGCYAIAEDIVAVDGNEGQEFRRHIRDRYLASPVLVSLLIKLDILWGSVGLATAALTLGLLFGLKNENAAYTLGWALPWGFAGVMTLVSFSMTKSALRRERGAVMNTSSTEYKSVPTVTEV